MSWLLHLYETYECNSDKIGVIDKKKNGQEYTLLPVSHTTQTAHIEVNITEKGEFHSASVVEKNDSSTLIPATENAANRAGSKVAPYPLHDKLSYTAGDFVHYGGQAKKREQYQAYIKQLEKWAQSPFATEKVISIYHYLLKGCLIKDLTAEYILYLDTEGNLINKWHKKYEDLHGPKPAIFSIAAGGQESAFIRFNVFSQEKLLTKIWNDKNVYDSFKNFYKDQLGAVDYCFVTGKEAPATTMHANKIRHSGDKAKLISANDKTGFTFRGRFKESREAATISYEVSQKAHNALKWLIHKQAKVIDQRVFLVWEKGQNHPPDPHEDSLNLFGTGETTPEGFTNEQFAKELSKAIDGYKHDISNSNDINIIVLDSATTGRLAVLYYRYLNKEIYLNRIKSWHSSCFWRHTYLKKPFFGAPATRDIAFAAYGPRANEKIVKGLMERMLPSIIDGRKIPADIVKSAFYRASNPLAMDKWEWEKTLSIACSLFNHKEGYDVRLAQEETNRDYLFGRLLAIADVLERRALGNEENRATNAIRYMNSFSRHPARTWKTIQSSLQPYQARLGPKAGYLSSLIDDVASRIAIEDFNNKPLSEKYLLGFYSQRHDLFQKRDKQPTTHEEE
ncbi:type I-C CRISPR-associated protein Cas8c/Csd1 [Salipaludibacillus aurantiacus]|uniref:CRISPR-associated protein Csd1 n=1 Tax=Salipaludibacillus aurantiacus TaxID=1601833 RepID=A0A1H9W962_9BACI|nr:type I-C CRISPR-associated protein Cas8c/Csd1 [Salipaludibacillus aurantiacus]SES30003.1 CRISPR-associated protein Csd1 [Salipaludibacillus aurantiacus]